MTRMQKALSDITYLWKKDDQDWIKKRKEDWIRLISCQRFDKISAKEKKLLKIYFLEGVLEEYYPPNAILLCTPATSAKELNNIFYSGFFDLESMRRLMSEFISYASEFEWVLPCIKEQIKFFIDGVLGKEYQEIMWKFPGSGNIKCISPDTTQWPMRYLRKCDDLFNHKITYHGYVECFDYFISILPHSTDPDFRRPNYLKNMLVAAESAQCNLALSAEVQEFAKQVCLRRQEIIDAWNVNAHLDEVKLDD
ncbi:MAG: hypothetical protein IPK77_02970 [Cellvibrio sp.]|nr:hypothetical protein [Cellvibrio sp.]